MAEKRRIVMDGSLTQKTFVVTGATSGIGLAAAEILASQGARVIGVGRSPERCHDAERRLHNLYPEAQVEYCLADLSLLSQVRRLAGEIHEELASSQTPYLDGLINNAGTFTYWLTLTAEGFETQWAVNYLAPFMLTHELLPLLKAAPMARVVTVSSGSHYGARLRWDDLQLIRHYNGLRAYGQTKLANVLFTVELNRRLDSGSTVRAFAADPGLVHTDIGLKGTPRLVGKIWAWRSGKGISPEESAKGIVYLACEPSIQDSPEIYWKHSAPVAPSEAALDEDAARKLWEISEKMCGIQQEGIQ
jgi:retinol dehydrogenase 12